MVYMLRFLRGNRVPPTVREISAGIASKSSNLDAYLTPLIKKGYLEKLPVASRCYLPTKLAYAWWELNRDADDPSFIDQLFPQP
jgi:hypothetical protein